MVETSGEDSSNFNIHSSETESIDSEVAKPHDDWIVATRKKRNPKNLKTITLKGNHNIQRLGGNMEKEVASNTFTWEVGLDSVHSGGSTCATSGVNINSRDIKKWQNVDILMPNNSKSGNTDTGPNSHIIEDDEEIMADESSPPTGMTKKDSSYPPQKFMFKDGKFTIVDKDMDDSMMAQVYTANAHEFMQQSNKTSMDF
ncbi:hypothetical protein TanjilG_21234 [Lupinus angustifolius]|uniref:Uncharacterized protein n=1 Tax=Lupinus angustifolius TaxID=3871 RepID=A0A1J7HAS5_LUPAN|nr:hypothetical protein TanjilG_21234 [Lupinus angustifolius]